MKLFNKIMKLFYKIASLCLLLGIIHTVLTPKFFPVMNDDWFWFSATGLTLIFSGLLNFFAIYGNRTWMYIICIVSNLTMVLWTILLIANTEHSPYWVLSMYLGVLIASVYYTFWNKNNMITEQ
jgi:hypothetical protein